MIEIGKGEPGAQAQAERYAAALAHDRLDRRDQAVCRAAERLCPPGGVHAKAAALERRLNSYLSTRWKWDKTLVAPPADADESAALCFEIARANEGRSLGARQIQNILSGRRSQKRAKFWGVDLSEPAPLGWRRARKRQKPVRIAQPGGAFDYRRGRGRAAPPFPGAGGRSA